MFIFSLTYVRPLSEVERLLPAHIQFLDSTIKSIFSCVLGGKYQEQVA